jgi:hypothetical protein
MFSIWGKENEHEAVVVIVILFEIRTRYSKTTNLVTFREKKLLGIM